MYLINTAQGVKQKGPWKTYKEKLLWNFSPGRGYFWGFLGDVIFQIDFKWWVELGQKALGERGKEISDRRKKLSEITEVRKHQLCLGTWVVSFGWDTRRMRGVLRHKIGWLYTQMKAARPYLESKWKAHMGIVAGQHFHPQTEDYQSF